MRILSAQWGNPAHDWIKLQVTDNSRTFNYILRESDTAPMAKRLSAMLDKNTVQEDNTTLILSGQKPLPEGYTIIGNQIVNDQLQERQAKEAVRRQLASMQTPENLARAEIDAEYAAERKETMRELLEVETQEGFPHEIEWPLTINERLGEAAVETGVKREPAEEFRP